MLIANGDDTFTSGPLDALIILKHEATHRYHVAFFEERPMPGPIAPVDEVKVVRLTSNMHHTEGALTLAEALDQRAELLQKLLVPSTNLFDEIVSWDGHLGLVLFYPNWLQAVPSPSF